MTGGLNQRVETKKSFVRGGVGFILGAGSWTAGKHFEIVGKWGHFVRVEQIFDRNRSADPRETSIGPLEVKGRCPVIRFILYDWSRSTFAGAKILRGGMGTKVTATDDYGGRSRSGWGFVQDAFCDTNLCERGERSRRAR